LAVRCNIQKSRPSSNIKVKGQTGQKAKKVRHFVRESSSGPRSSAARGPPRVLRRWENQRMLSSVTCCFDLYKCQTFCSSIYMFCTMPYLYYTQVLICSLMHLQHLHCLICATEILLLHRSYSRGFRHGVERQKLENLTVKSHEKKGDE